MMLGAGHAFLPGHGKTIMAAYLVGKRGSYRDVATVGATVTLTHTGGVLVIGLLLSLSAALAPTVVVQDLAVLSGLIVAGVGLWLLTTAVRRRPPLPVLDDPAVAPALAYAGTAPGHSHTGTAHGDHGHEAAAGHADDHAHDGFSRKGLVGLGVAGGLVPSPSALLVLLAAVRSGARSSASCWWSAMEWGWRWPSPPPGCCSSGCAGGSCRSPAPARSPGCWPPCRS